MDKKNMTNNLINKIVSWYELTYPDFILEKKENDNKENFNIEWFKSRITDVERDLIDVKYQTNASAPVNCIKEYDNNGNYMRSKHKILYGLTYKSNSSNNYISFDPDGYIDLVYLSEPFYKNRKNPLHIKEFYDTLTQVYSKGNFSKVKKCLDNYNNSIQLRNMIFNEAFLLIESHDNTEGKSRANKFVDDINQEYSQIIINKFNTPIVKVRVKK